MLDFVKSAFRGFFEVLLWINLILCAIGGGIVSSELLGGRNGGNPISGFIVGLIIGLLIDIVGGGFIATILSIDENLEQLKNNVRGGSSLLNSGKVSPSPSIRLQGATRCKRCGKTVDAGYTACPHCGGSEFE